MNVILCTKTKSWVEQFSFFHLIGLLVFSAVAHAGSDDHAKLVSVDIPSYMISGEKYKVRIEYKNAGATTWSSGRNYRIGWGDPALSKHWGVLRTGVLFNTPVAPGETAVIEFNLTAPDVTGESMLSWRLLDPNGVPFGEPAEVKSLRIENPDNQASVVSQLVPDEVAAGEHFMVLIQMKNIGRTTWSRDQGFYLATVNSFDWSLDKLELQPTAHVAPDETVTFKASLVAPLQAGEHRLQWQMRHKHTYFGDITPMVKVRVGRQAVSKSDAEFVYQDVGRTMLAGDSNEVTLQFKNTSQFSWRVGEVALVSPAIIGLTWAIDSVELKPGEVIAPGEFAVFRFNVQAPNEPGSYPFQWQLRHNRDGLFGMPSERLLIDVK